MYQVIGTYVPMMLNMFTNEATRRSARARLARNILPVVFRYLVK